VEEVGSSVEPYPKCVEHRSETTLPLASACMSEFTSVDLDIALFFSFIFSFFSFPL